LIGAYLPLGAWYACLGHHFGGWFVAVHWTWLRNEVYGPLSPAWRRYTGTLEYAGMLLKSYWPWLPAMIAGIMLVIRGGDRRLWLLVLWPAVIFVLCAMARSRVLRYLLPAYPAFAILAAIGLRNLAGRFLRVGLRVATPLAALGVLAVAAIPRTHLEAAEVRAMARAATSATPAGERVGFYDGGQPRYDETNQMQWYGDRFLIPLFQREALLEALRSGRVRVVVLDRNTYQAWVAPAIPHQVLAEGGHLLCIRVR
jgi:hypothetical protein